MVYLFQHECLVNKVSVKGFSNISFELNPEENLVPLDQLRSMFLIPWVMARECTILCAR